MGILWDAKPITIVGFVVAIVSFVLQLIGFATSYWIYRKMGDAEYHVGLWQMCLQREYYDVTDELFVTKIKNLHSTCLLLYLFIDFLLTEFCILFRHLSNVEDLMCLLL